MMTEEELLTFIEKEYSEVYVGADSLPKPYVGKNEIKAILLGADPGTENNKIFEYVFGLESKDLRYSTFIRNNLGVLNNLSIDNLYIQNMCKNYFNCDSDKNRYWKEVAKLWIPLIKADLDTRFDRNVPILLSAEKILSVVLKGKEKKKSARYYYENIHFIDEDKNVFERVLMPFYRHCDYKLSKWNDYKNKIDSIFFD